MAPKFGNVDAMNRFADLTASDFLIGAEKLAIASETHHRIGAIILSAVRDSMSATLSNANLGICLLIGPLVAAVRMVETEGMTLHNAIEQVLSQLTAQDAADVFTAIREANPGGLGQSKEMDVADQPPSDLIAAMRHAEDRDLIARQFSRNFVDVLDTFLPILSANIERYGDALWGIRQAQLDLLAQYPDSLIGRKCGAAVAAAVSLRASELRKIQIGNIRSDAEQGFDAWLRADGNRLNPGTTADLIAAGLFLLLGPQSVDRN